MEHATVNIRMEKNIKTEAENLFAEMGLNMSTAINIFVRQAVRQHKIPFEIYVDKTPMAGKKNRQAAFGYLKGKINVPDDFNDPLDDFSEYMQ